MLAYPSDTLKYLVHDVRRVRFCAIDKSIVRPYLCLMVNLARFFIVVLLAVFSTGSVVYATNATTMAVKMVHADSGPMAAADCTGCNADSTDNKSGLTCDIAVCPPSFVAYVSTGFTFRVPVAVSTIAPEGKYNFLGRVDPRDPFPPRTLI